MRCTDMHGFLSDCRRHERSSCHLEAFKKWKTFDVTEMINFLFPLVNCCWIMKYICRVELSLFIIVVIISGKVEGHAGRAEPD